ncbi:MAG: hypothetical protein ACRDK0_13605, partial [Solirubrobacteraceae bacterium]
PPSAAKVCRCVAGGSMQLNRKRLAALVALLAAAGMLAAALSALSLTAAEEARATVPPRNCGMIGVNGKRYQIKADQIRCRTAKTHSRRYLSTSRRPSGYRCRNYNGGTKLKFRCWKGDRLFFAIRR